MPQGQAENQNGRNAPLIGLLGGSAMDRTAYRLLLKHELNVDVAVEADFAPTSVWEAMRVKPNVVIVDADQAFPAALDAVEMIARLYPDTRILILGAGADPVQLDPWSRYRIHGYIVKDAGPDELRKALAALLDDRKYFSEGVRRPPRRRGSSYALEDARPRLSRREAELLPLLARGMTLRDAAQKLAVSYKTADSYRSNILRKLGLRDRVELARYAIRERIVEP